MIPEEPDGRIRLKFVCMIERENQRGTVRIKAMIRRRIGSVISRQRIRSRPAGRRRPQHSQIFDLGKLCLIDYRNSKLFKVVKY